MCGCSTRGSGSTSLKLNNICRKYYHMYNLPSCYILASFMKYNKDSVIFHSTIGEGIKCNFIIFETDIVQVIDTIMPINLLDYKDSWNINSQNLHFYWNANLIFEWDRLIILMKDFISEYNAILWNLDK